MGVGNIVKPVTAPLVDRVDAVYEANHDALSHRLRTRAVHLPPNRVAQSHWLLTSADPGLAA
jgi:hypothetical protein